MHSWVILRKDFFVFVTFYLYFGGGNIEDIFMLWQHGEKELKKFSEILNSCHLTIKFIANYSRDKIRFLDVEIIKKGNQLVADLSIKHRHIHQYIHAFLSRFSL